MVLFVSLLRDGAGRLVTNPEAISLIAGTSNVPVYSWAETHLGHGIVGRLASFEAQGARPRSSGCVYSAASSRRTCPSSTARTPPTCSTSGSSAAGASARIAPGWKHRAISGPDPVVALLGIGPERLSLCSVSLVWGLLLQRTGRRRVELSLDERLKFESLLSELSAALIEISLNDLDNEIGRGLRRVGEFLKVDRANLHEYVAEGPSFASPGPWKGSSRCHGSWRLVGSRGRPNSSGGDTSSGSPGWTNFPSRPRSIGRAIGKRHAVMTCRSRSAPATPS